MRVTPEEVAMLTVRRDGMPPVKARTPTTRKEGEIVAAILAYLKLRPDVVAWRNNTGAVKEGTRFIRFGVKGMPDIIGWRHHCLTGSFHDGQCVERRPAHGPVARFLAIEVKRPKRYPTVEQEAFLELVRRAGGIAIVASSVEDVRRALPEPATLKR